MVNATFHLVSSKLLAVWKADLNTSLAALELLAFLAEILAKLRVPDQRRLFFYNFNFPCLHCIINSCNM